jgi:hypothetical protein
LTSRASPYAQQSSSSNRVTAQSSGLLLTQDDKKKYDKKKMLQRLFERSSDLLLTPMTTGAGMLRAQKKIDGEKKRKCFIEAITSCSLFSFGHCRKKECMNAFESL